MGVYAKTGPVKVGWCRGGPGAGRRSAHCCHDGDWVQDAAETGMGGAPGWRRCSHHGRLRRDGTSEGGLVPGLPWGGGRRSTHCCHDGDWV